MLFGMGWVVWCGIGSKQRETLHKTSIYAKHDICELYINYRMECKSYKKCLHDENKTKCHENDTKCYENIHKIQIKMTQKRKIENHKSVTKNVCMMKTKRNVMKTYMRFRSKYEYMDLSWVRPSVHHVFKHVVFIAFSSYRHFL